MSITTKLSSLRFFLRPRKFVAQYKLFFYDEWLEASVDSIAPYMYRILFVVSDVAWGDNLHNPTIECDNLNPVLSHLKSKYPNKVVIVKGSWNAQLVHVQAGLDYIKENIPEATHCLYIDSDEIYTQQQIKRLLSLANKLDTFNKAIRISYNTYFKSIYYKVWPIKYPTALALFPIMDWVQYRNERNVNAQIIERPDIFYEHPSYVRADNEKIRLKIEAHRETEQIIGDWYSNVWLCWTPATQNFHPTNPNFWERTILVEEKELPLGMVKAYKKMIEKI